MSSLLTIRLSTLNGLSTSSLGLLLMGCQVRNELNALHKLVILCLPDDGRAAEAERLGQLSQAMLVFRLMVGKLHEAGEFLRKVRKRRPEAVQDDHRMRRFLAASRENKVISRTRQKTAFHFNEDFLIRGFKKIPEDEVPTAYTCDDGPETYYHFAEQAVLHELFEVTRGSAAADEAAVQEYIDDVLNVAADIIALVDSIVMWIVRRHDIELEHEEGSIERTPKITIPYFIELERMQVEPPAEISNLEKRGSK